MHVSCFNCGAALTTTHCGYCGTSYKTEGDKQADKLSEEQSVKDLETEKERIVISQKIEYLRSSHAPEAVKFKKIAYLEQQLKELG